MKTVNPVRRMLQRQRAEDRNLGHKGPSSLPACAWPGGYTIIYLDRDGSVLCHGCATDALNEQIGTPDRDRRDVPIACDTYDEGPTMNCDGCNVEIESSYGDPDDESDEEAAY